MLLSSLTSTFTSSLKSKEPRLRDWNIDSHRLVGGLFGRAWNQKNLDYEIETTMPTGQTARTRYTWNQKNLDYEIETNWRVVASAGTLHLEIKRTSITRLKLQLNVFSDRII